MEPKRVGTASSCWGFHSPELTARLEKKIDADIDSKESSEQRAEG